MSQFMHLFYISLFLQFLCAFPLFFIVIYFSRFLYLQPSLFCFPLASLSFRFFPYFSLFPFQIIFLLFLSFLLSLAPSLCLSHYSLIYFYLFNFFVIYLIITRLILM